MRHSSSRLLIATAFVAISCCLLASCSKKDHPKPSPTGPGGTSSTTDEDSLKYLMYGIMQVSFVDGGRDKTHDLPTYYWYQQVPKVDPFSKNFPKADDLLSHLISYPVNPGTGGAIDRYSFLDRTGQVSDEIQNGVVDGVFSGIDQTGSLGMNAGYVLDDQGKSHIFVLYADKNSPAGKQGIQRGWEITAINGDTALSYDGPTGSHVTKAGNAIFGSVKTEFTFQTLKQTSTTITVAPASYNVNPILFDTVYTRNNKKIGYFVFYTFSSTISDAGTPTPTRSLLDHEFEKLTAAGISDLVVDLRYNGGGAVTTAEYLDSAIAPATTKGKLMYQFIYNDKLTKQSGLLGLDSKINFPGGGGLNLEHVFFIVSRSTASASELTINNLKPYMNVKLVGDTTYGKPVGFIDFPISDYDSTGTPKYLADLYAIDFETKNANGNGGYFEGIPPDVVAMDYVTLNWGDPNDDNLSKIFSYIATGSFRNSGPSQRLAPEQMLSNPLEGGIPSRRFRGMVDYRLRGKINARLGVSATRPNVR